MQPPTDNVTLKEFSGKYSPDLILTNAQKGEGRAGSQNPQRFAKQQIRKDQLKNASVRYNVSHKISKRPVRTPLRSRTLEEETADRIGLQFNFA